MSAEDQAVQKTRTEDEAAAMLILGQMMSKRTDDLEEALKKEREKFKKELEEEKRKEEQLDAKFEEEKSKEEQLEEEMQNCEEKLKKKEQECEEKLQKEKEECKKKLKEEEEECKDSIDLMKKENLKYMNESNALLTEKLILQAKVNKLEDDLKKTPNQRSNEEIEELRSKISTEKATVEQLKSQNTELQSENARLRGQINDNRNETTDKERQQNSNLSIGEVKLLSQRFKNSLTKLTKLIDTYYRHDANYGEYKENMKEAEKFAETFYKEILSNKKGALFSLLSFIVNQNEGLVDSFENHSSSIEEKNSKIDQCEKEGKEKDTEIEKLKARIAELEAGKPSNDQSERIKELERKWELEKSTKDMRILDLEDEIKKLTAENNSCKEEGEKKNAEIQKLKAEKNALNKSFLQQYQELKSTFNNLQQQSKDQLTRIQQLQSQISEKNVEIVRLRNLNKQNPPNTPLNTQREDELRELREKIASLELQLGKSSNEYNMLKFQKEYSDNRNKDLQQQLAAAKKEIERLNKNPVFCTGEDDQLNEARRTIAELQAELKAAENRFKELLAAERKKCELETGSLRELNREEVGLLEQKIAEISNESLRQVQKIAILEKDKEKLKKELEEETKTSVEIYSNELDKKKKEIKKLNEQIENLRDKGDATEKGLRAEANTKITELSGQLTRKEQDIKQKEAEINALKDQIRTFNDEKAVLEGKLEILSQEDLSKKGQISSLREQLENTIARNKLVEALKDDAASQIGKARAKAQGLELDKNQLENEKRGLQGKIETLERHIEDLRQKLGGLSKGSSSAGGPDVGSEDDFSDGVPGLESVDLGGSSSSAEPAVRSEGDVSDGVPGLESVDPDVKDNERLDDTGKSNSSQSSEDLRERVMKRRIPGGTDTPESPRGIGGASKTDSSESPRKLRKFWRRDKNSEQAKFTKAYKFFITDSQLDQSNVQQELLKNEELVARLTEKYEEESKVTADEYDVTAAWVATNTYIYIDEINSQLNRYYKDSDAFSDNEKNELFEKAEFIGKLMNEVITRLGFYGSTSPTGLLSKFQNLRF
jgi:chromosome segregation ATPase